MKDPGSWSGTVTWRRCDGLGGDSMSQRDVVVERRLIEMDVTKDLEFQYHQLPLTLSIDHL